MDLRTLDWDPDMLDAMGVPRCDAAGDPLLERGLRRGARAPGRGADRRATSATSRRPSSARPASRRARPRTPTAPAASCSSTPATEPVASASGLLTTVGYRIGDEPAVYALEGSIAIAGALVQWLRDNLGLIPDAPPIEALARTVDDNGGVYFVPAFSGLFAPHWRPDARGVIVGLTGYVTGGHLARAVLEATA